ncbi:hypothetical protein GYMLUDRAFT_826941 [Collybiopsis luxurians FD-317 M1]|uniref:Uncharacterized protein n=1 Tax=Collybiopsis luxurians FD-317 M1 TaxID=944289 RepID=A0A0D0C1E5_9AGAR|nr:hypothetical protein GYMLUDRAFT_826941 [Collybiopsis luxurians FD-317 M1]
MTFSFSGSFISVIGDLYAGGTCNGTFSIDGTVSNFTSAATSITQNQQTLWSSSALNEGNHTLIYTASSCNSSQSFVSIDYLLYNSSSTSVSGATSFFDDRNSSLVYSGNSNSTSGIGDFQGTITGLQKGGSFQFGFNGTSVQVYGRVDNASVGVVDASFSVDGAPSVPFTAVTSNNVVHNKQFFASRTLNPGQHTLIVNNTGDNPVWVDYVLVRGQTSIGGAAPAANTSGSSHLRLDIVIASVVGGVVGIALLSFKESPDKQSTTSRTGIGSCFSPSSSKIRSSRYTFFSIRSCQQFCRASPTHPSTIPALSKFQHP